MRSLIQQDATAFAGPGCPPGTGIIVVLGPVPVGNDPDRALQITQFTVCDHFLGLGKQRVGSLIEHNTEDLSGFPGSLVHLLCNSDTDIHRLFHQDMLACLHGSHGNFTVERVRNRHHNGIQILPGNDVFPVGIGCHIGEILFQIVQTLRCQITGSHQFQTLDASAANAVHMGTAHIADTDDGSFYRFHIVPPSYEMLTRLQQLHGGADGAVHVALLREYTVLILQGGKYLIIPQTEFPQC